MGKLFLDSANIETIERMMSLDCIAGVTTNPSLMAKEEKGDYFERIHSIAECVSSRYLKFKRHLSVEVITLNPTEMIVQAKKIKKLLSPFARHLDIYVKVPVSYDNLAVISNLSNDGINVNATACMNMLQAKLGADAGAKIVSFFWNRIIDGAGEPQSHVADFCAIRNKTVLEETIVQTGSAIICGSIRRPQNVLDAWMSGAEFVTASEKVIQEMCQHDQTDLAIQQFQGDIDKWLK